MSKIFKDQFLNLEVDTKIDLTEATTMRICYIKPSGTTGEWVATKNADDPDQKTKLFCPVPSFDEAGVWKIYGKSTFEQGIIPGEVAEITVFNEGS